MDNPFLTRRTRPKTSGTRAHVGETASSWAQRCYAELVRQQPWVAKYSVRKSIYAEDQSAGYAVGYFHIGPKVIPAHVADINDVNVITVPIIIEDFKAYPFDVFYFNGSLFPLRETRATSILDLPDIFDQPVERNLSELLRRNYYNSGRRGGSEYGLLQGVKYSSVKDSTLRVATDCIKQANAAVEGLRKVSNAVLADNEEGLQSLRDADPLFAAMLEDQLHGLQKRSSDDAEEADELQLVAEHLEQSAAVYALEFRKTSSSLDVRPHWASSPTAGAREPGEWEPTSLWEVQKVSQVLADQVLADGAAIYAVAEGSSAFPEAVRAHAERDVHLQDHAAEAQAQSDELFRKLSMTVEGASVRKVEFVNKAGIPGLPDDGSAWLIYNCTGTKSYDLAGLLLESGEALLLGEGYYPGDLARAMALVPSDEKSAAPKVTSAKWATRGGLAPARAAMWATEDVVRVLPLSGDDITINGEKAYGVGESCYRWQMAIPADIKRAMTDVADSANVYIPRDADVVDVSAVEAIRIPYEDVGSVQMSKSSSALPDTLRHVSDLGWSVAGQPWTDKTSAVLELVYRGSDVPSAEQLCDAAEEDGLVRIPGDVSKWSSVAAAEAVAEVMERYADVQRVADDVVSGVDTSSMAEAAMTMYESLPPSAKQSSVLRESVNSVLSLGFLNRRTLMKFVKQVDNLEEMQSALCGLLLASRLGLKEIPQEAAEAAIDAMEPILTGLKSVEHSLRVM
jgi:hypothetical protein